MEDLKNVLSGKHEFDPTKETKEEHEKHVQNELPVLRGMGLKTTTGGIMGYCAGSFAKQVSNLLIFYAGCASTFLGLLSYCNYISINWRKIDADIFHLMAKA